MPILDPAWVLAAMTHLEPASPYRETFGRTAAAIARAADRSPLPGQDAPKTAAILVAVAWFESRFQVDAQGDCGKGQCTSFGLLQVNETNLSGLRVTRDDLLLDVDRAVDVGLTMMRRSFQVCRSQPLRDRLRWYARGGDGCSEHPDAIAKSRHRMDLAIRLLTRLPPPPSRSAS